MFLSPIMARLAVCRSTGPVDRSSSRSTGAGPTCTSVHASLSWWAGRLGRSRELCSLEMAPVDRAGRPGRSTGRELCSLYPVPVDRRHNGHKND